MAEEVDHPLHYGGAENPYETIKVIEAWGLDRDFALGNAVKYISRAGKKDTGAFLADLEKAAWYLARKIRNVRSTMEPRGGQPPRTPDKGTSDSEPDRFDPKTPPRVGGW